MIGTLGARTYTLIRGVVFSSMLVLPLFLAGLFELPLPAQVVTATLSGTVADSTGAVIPGAQVTAKNQASGYVRSTKTNGVGIFLFSAIDSGDYTLTVTVKNFETSVQEGIHLDPGDSRTLTDIKLVPGAETVSVVVNATLSSVLETGERSQLITSDDLQRLSTEGRDVTELEKILPGSAINVGNGAFGNAAASNTTYDPGQVTVGGGSSAYSMSGAPVNGVSVRSDGVNLNDPASYSGSTQTVNTEATAEVKVEQSNFGADTANGPVVIDAVGKAGGTEYHGSLYAHARTSQLNATDALANATGAAKPPDRYVYPGGTLSGPIRIPGTNFNHNKKLVFFGQAEDYAQRHVYAYNNPAQGIYHALVPTAGMLQGDFSPAQITKYLPPGAVNCSGGSCSVVKCAPGAVNCFDYSRYSSVAFVPTTDLHGNPINCTGNAFSSCMTGSGVLNAGALAVMKLIPAPNTPMGQTNSQGFNYVSNNLVNNNLWSAHARVDLVQTERSKFFGTYTVERGLTGIPQNQDYFGSGSSGGVNTPGSSLKNTNSQSGSINWTLVISPTLTNEAFASAAYLDETFRAGDQSKLNYAALNYPQPYPSAYKNGTQEYPTLVDYGYDGLPIGLFPDYSYGQFYRKRLTPGFGDNLTKVWRQHTLKFGVNVERTTDNSVNPGAGGIPTNGGIQNYYVNSSFQLPCVVGTSPYCKAPVGMPHAESGLETFDNTCGISNCGTPGNLLASFLEGEFFKYQQANLQARINLFWWSTAFYATDSWKVRRNMTLTLGLRVEHEGEWQDAHHVGIPVFIPSTYATEDPSPSNPLPGFHWHTIDPAIPNSGQTVNPLFLDPRFGFSWDVHGNGKTVIGGGYGWYRFHDNWADVANALAVSEGQRTVFLSNPYPTSYGGNSNGLTLDYIGGLDLNPSDPKVAEGSLATTGLLAFDQHDHKQPLTATYSLTITQQLGGTVLSLGYVGNNSNSILNDGSNGSITVDNVNAIHPNGVYQPDPTPVAVVNAIAANGQLVPKVGPNPFYGTTYTPQSMAGIVGAGGSSTPTAPSINDWRPYPLYGQLQLEAHTLFANYNGIQATWNKAKGWLTYGANYTWSKAMGVRGGYNNGIPGDSFNVWNDYGPLAYDRSQIFNVWYYVDGGEHVKGNKVLQAIANRWAISGWTGVQSGPNLQATNYGTNFGLQGDLGQGAVAGSAYAANTIWVSNAIFLGTPDVSLQPKLKCNPANHTKRNQFINGDCFYLPQVGGDNGPFIYPYIHGPGFFDTDLTVFKNIKLNDRQALQFSVAGFNFINHPLTTFTNLNPFAEQLDFVNENNTSPAGATQVNSDFGTTNYKVGRRILELSAKFTF